MSVWKAESVGPAIGWLVATYLFVMATASAVAVVDVFPTRATVPVQAVTGTPAPRQAVSHIEQLQFTGGRFLGIDLGKPTPATGLAMLAVLAGILGACLHGMNSLANYQGNKQLELSWTMFYALRPPIGAAIGLMSYFIIRAGFLTGPDATTSPYGVIAFAGLCGLFADRALEMFGNVFQAIFHAPDKRTDGLDAATKPKVASVTPNPVPAGGGDVELVVRGESFVESCVVQLDGKPRAVTFGGESELRVQVPAADRPKSRTVGLVVIIPAPRKLQSDRFEVRFE